MQEGGKTIAILALRNWWTTHEECFKNTDAIDKKCGFLLQNKNFLDICIVWLIDTGRVHCSEFSDFMARSVNSTAFQPMSGNCTWRPGNLSGHRWSRNKTNANSSDQWSRSYSSFITHHHFVQDVLQLFRGYNHAERRLWSIHELPERNSQWVNLKKQKPYQYMQ